jgi:hypothetical protein
MQGMQQTSAQLEQGVVHTEHFQSAPHLFAVGGGLPVECLVHVCDGRWLMQSLAPRSDAGSRPHTLYLIVWCHWYSNWTIVQRYVMVLVACCV